MRRTCRVVLFAGLIGLALPTGAVESGPAGAPPRAQQQIADATRDFEALTGPQIQRLFQDLEFVEYPDDGGGGSGNFLFTFNSNGS